VTRLRVVSGGLADAPAAGERAAARPPARDAAAAADRVLLARVASGDATAHRQLFDRYHARVHAFVCRRVSDAGLAEEIVADVFHEVWRGAGAYRGESLVSSWVFGIANLKALSARRFHAQPRHASVRPTEDEVLHRVPDPRDPDAALDARDELARLLGVITRLPAGQRDVLRLAFFEGRSYEEIARELGISVGNVKTRVNRARSRLRALVRHRPEGVRT